MSNYTSSTNMSLEIPIDGNTNNQWGVYLNRTFNSLDSAVLSNNFAQDTDNTTGLDFYYKNGRIMNGKSIVNVAASHITLDDDDTSYVEVSKTGTVSSNTTGFTSGSIPLYTVITLSSVITTITDCRAYYQVHETISVDSSQNTEIGTSSHNTTFDVDGKQSMSGNGRVKRMLKISARDLGVGVTPPSGGIYDSFLTYKYTISDDSYITIAIPEDMDTSGTLDIYATWIINEAYATNSGEIQWRIDWDSAAIGEQTDTCTTGNNVTGDIDIPATAKTLVRTQLVSIGTISANDIFGMKISRIAIDDGNNPSAQEPAILCLDLEYTCNKLGKDL